ncbi:MAG TPA: PIG-L family deacetylase [Chloroflexota bacterium]|nr:PIG-L family deacetylase [Chloroflexota bacterium]
MAANGVRLLVVRPHPDDESSATGGILARYAAQGVRTGVVTCTRGEEGEIHDPALDPEEARPRLGAIREQELYTACRILGVAEVRLLGYRDSGMAGSPANQHPDAFCNADLDEAAGRLVRIIRELQPQVVITENWEGSYGHPDHIMGHRVTRRAFFAAGDPHCYPDAGPPWRPQRLYAVVPVRDRWEELIELLRREGQDTSFLERRRRDPHFGIPKEQTTVQLDVADYVEIQRQALAAHRTQIPPDSWWLTLPPHIRRVAFGTAYLVRYFPTPAPGERDADLFAGLD